MREGAERLLEGPHSLTMSRPRHSRLPRLAAVCYSLVPHLTSQGMVGQTVDQVASTLPGVGFEGRDNLRVQVTPPLRQETTVGYFVGERVFEGERTLRKELCLV